MEVADARGEVATTTSRRMFLRAASRSTSGMRDADLSSRPSTWRTKCSVLCLRNPRKSSDSSSREAFELLAVLMYLSISCGGWKELLHTQAWSRSPGGCRKDHSCCCFCTFGSAPVFFFLFSFFPQQIRTWQRWVSAILSSICILSYHPSGNLWFHSNGRKQILYLVRAWLLFKSADLCPWQDQRFSFPCYFTARVLACDGWWKKRVVWCFRVVMTWICFWRGCLQSAFPQQYNVEGISKAFKATIVQHSRISIPLQEFFFFAFLGFFCPRERSSVITTPLVLNKQGFLVLQKKGHVNNPQSRGMPQNS